jgi:hypothetical protein
MNRHTFVAWLIMWVFVGAACTSEGSGYTQQYSAGDFARATAAAQLAYGPSMHCGKSEFGYGYTCSDEVNCYDNGTAERVAWECINGHSLEGNPSTCVIEQNGRLRITRREDDPRECR